MDVISVEGEPPNYLFPFLIGDFLLVLTFIMILLIKMDLSLPKVIYIQLKRFIYSQLSSSDQSLKYCRLTWNKTLLKGS